MTIYCVGRNYVKHAEELGNQVPSTPMIFLKSQSSLRGLTQAPMAFAIEVFHHELELVIRIKRDIDYNQSFSLKDIDSIGLGIDLTRRDVQNELKKQGHPWTLSKSFMGSAILGKLYPFEKYNNERNIEFTLHVNDELKQNGHSQNMIFNFMDICQYIHSFSPLRAGDLIFTGTPEGVWEMKRGDHFKFKLGQEDEEFGVL